MGAGAKPFRANSFVSVAPKRGKVELLDQYGPQSPLVIF
jgi:hypothetical protein